MIIEIILVNLICFYKKIQNNFLNSGYKILIIDDEEKIRTLLQKILMLEGFDVITAGDCKTGMKMIENEKIAILITDVKLPDGNGIEITKQVKEKYNDIEIIVLTAYGQIKDGVTAMKAGAYDYLVKGDDDDKLPLLINNAYDKFMITLQLKHLRNRFDEKFSFNAIMGKSEKISKAIELAKRVSQTDSTVLLTGETGTGKDLFAQAIHNAGRRRNNNFVVINCSAIPKDLQESELFGYRKGAFTGAAADKKGYFEEADKGTIFLDEVAEMSPETQSKLLRVLENRKIAKVGDTKEYDVDIRIIAATNKDLEEEIRNNRFRQDLYYRLNTFMIGLPSLRERKEDIELLTNLFVKNYSEKSGKKIDSISRGFLNELMNHSFEGNIRELKNVIERAVILCDSNEISEELLPDDFSKNISSGSTLGSIEKEHIIKTLKENNGNKTLTAKALGIGTVTLYRKLKEFGME